MLAMFDKSNKGWLIKFVEKNDRAIVEVLEVDVPKVEEAIVEFPKVWSDNMKALYLKIEKHRERILKNMKVKMREWERKQRIERKLVFLIDNENIHCMRYFY